jgi:hypothetical protein
MRTVHKDIYNPLSIIGAFWAVQVRIWQDYAVMIEFGRHYWSGETGNMQSVAITLISAFTLPYVCQFQVTFARADGRQMPFGERRHKPLKACSHS